MTYQGNRIIGFMHKHTHIHVHTNIITGAEKCCYQAVVNCKPFNDLIQPQSEDPRNKRSSVYAQEKNWVLNERRKTIWISSHFYVFIFNFTSKRHS